MKKPFFISLVLFFIFSRCTTTEIPIDIVEPILTTVTYDTDVKAIIDNNCISCHVTNGQASFLPLVNYTQVRRSAESGTLIESMNDVVDPMPKSGLLSAQTRAVIDAWKVDGFLEN